MNPIRERRLMLTRRQLFGRAATGIGTAALGSLLAPQARAAKGLPGFPNFPGKAKRVIYLHQSGAPSQMDLFDYKPGLAKRFAEELPDSIRQGQRLTGMTSAQKKFPVAPSVYKFARHGQGGAWFSELLPNTAKIADDICVVRSLFTEAINHDPAITFIQTGSQVAGRPEIVTRIRQYEMAYRMQTSVPELTDLSKEPASTFDLYGPDSRKPGTYAANCVLARRLAERGVRFIQLYHMGWDHHEGVPRQLPPQCMDTDQASAALITDLKQRGMLDDTLVVWGGEFGRTVYCQGNLSPENYGRDHHPRCFSVWMAGGGIKGGVSYGETDDYSYNITENPVHVHDMNATLMHCLGVDHTKLTYRYQGRDFRLTDVHGTVVKELLA